MDAMRERHSVRQYKDIKIETEKRTAMTELIEQCNDESGLHIQILFDEPRCFKGIMAHYGKFSGVDNYIALVGKKGAGLEETAGYYGERIVLRAQELGLNTCWVAMTHGKSMARIKNDEKQVCLIAIGYGESQGVPHTNKPVEEVCNCAKQMPEWFEKGIEAALLAPTATNQQKFYFELKGDKVILKIKGNGFYTKMDLGIVKYHFEIASGHRVEYSA
jgi:nitroreductase